MYIFAKFEINKLEFFGELGSVEKNIKYMVESHMSSNHFPNKKLEFKNIEKKDYMAYVYGTYLQNVGFNVPEFKNKYIDFLNRLMRIGEVTNNLKEIKKKKYMANNFEEFELQKINPDNIELEDEDRKKIKKEKKII